VAVADNAVGIKLAPAQNGFVLGPWECNAITHALVVGATPGHLGAAAVKGVIGAADHGHLFNHITFGGFPANASQSWALQACSECEIWTPLDGGVNSPPALYKLLFRWFFAGWEGRFANVTWADDAENRVLWRWSHEGTWTDLDGTLSEADPSLPLPLALVPWTPVLRGMPECNVNKGELNRSIGKVSGVLRRLCAAYNGSWGGSICPGRTFRRFGANNVQPWCAKWHSTHLLTWTFPHFLFRWYIYRGMTIFVGTGNSSLNSTQWITDEVPYLVNRRVNPNGWAALLPTNETITLGWDLEGFSTTVDMLVYT
jgi:hypothetical protein